MAEVAISSDPDYIGHVIHASQISSHVLGALVEYLTPGSTVYPASVMMPFSWGLSSLLHRLITWPSVTIATSSNSIQIVDNGIPCGCPALAQLLHANTFYPGDATYEYEVGHFWSNTQILKPACVVRPTSTEDVSAVIKTSRLTGTKFAIRAGGHMPVRGANSVDDGILMVMSNLTSIAIAPDRASVDVGPGLTWSDVYAYLIDFERTAVGGRISPIGVPGLVLGGGISLHGNQYGWAADNVLEYEVVLANGEVAIANETSNNDLFWALKGGGPNFGIVTNFKLRAIPSTKVLAGIYTMAGAEIEPLMSVSEHAVYWRVNKATADVCRR